MSAPNELDPSPGLLRRWYQGDAEALAVLVERNLPWLRQYVHRKLDAKLRAIEATEDVVQGCFIALMKQGPRFEPRDEGQFRALVAKVVVNRLRDLHDYAHAAKRDVGREAVAPSIASHADWAACSSLQPDRVAEKDEMRGTVQLALMLLDPSDRHVIHLREWEKLEFAEIGQRLGCNADAARMRFNRAIAELGSRVKRVHEGRIDDLERELDEGLAAHP